VLQAHILKGFALRLPGSGLKVAKPEGITPLMLIFHFFFAF
jgi:hypothetical protein